MKRFRYDVYGALLGAGLPIVATFIEALRLYDSVAPLALLRAHLNQPLLWIMDTTPFVLGALGKIIVNQHHDLVRQHEEIVRQSDEIVRLEQARRESFDRTAKELFHAAQGLLGNVAAFTSTSAGAAASVRQTTAAMNQLSQSATAAALTAETVIGIALQAERASADGLRHAEATGEELVGLAEEVRALSRQIEALNVRMGDVYEVAGLVGAVAERARLIARAATEAVASSPAPGGLGELAAELERQSEEARAAASRVKGVLTEVHRAMLAAVSAAEHGIGRAQSGAKIATQTSDTIRGLSTALGESARAAREIARVAQQQEGAIEQALKAMNQISHATEETLASTHEVAREARSLNELASFLKTATKG
jgi:methyl-accepting chemotaxis protein